MLVPESSRYAARAAPSTFQSSSSRDVSEDIPRVSRARTVESYLESFRHLVCASVFLNVFSRSSLPIPIPTSAESRLGLIRLAAPSIRRRWRTEEDAMIGMREAEKGSRLVVVGEGKNGSARAGCQSLDRCLRRTAKRRRARQIGGRCCAALRCVALRSVGRSEPLQGNVREMERRKTEFALW